MKKTTFIVVLLMLILASKAQNFVWAKNAGGTKSDYGNSVATDASGNVYVTGAFRSSSITLGSTTLTNANGNTVTLFIVKYNASGNVLWAKKVGGVNGQSCEGTAIAVDNNGNVFLTGIFYNPAIVIGTTTLTHAGGGFGDMFIAKYDSNGNVLWAKSAGGTAAEYSESITTEASGNVYVTGYYSSASITFGTTTLTNVGGHDIFIVKYDGNGNVLWAKNAGGNYTDFAEAIATDVSGNIYITGSFYSPSITFGTITLTGNGTASKIFTVKYDSNGNALWANSVGGADDDFGNSITTDGIGNVYVTGSFQSSFIIFGTTTLTNVGLGDSDMFIVKYDGSGNVLWAKRAGGYENEYSPSIASDLSGNVYIFGSFNSNSIAFGTIGVFNTTYNSLSVSADLYIVKFDSNGNVNWAESAGGYGFDFANSIAIGGAGSLYVTGSYQQYPIIFGTTTLPNQSMEDIFIAKFDGLTSIEEDNMKNSLSIFPNPASNQLNLSYILKENKQVQVKIYNVIGEDVIIDATKNGLQGLNSLKLNVEALPNGIYFAQIIAEGEASETKRFIISK